MNGGEEALCCSVLCSFLFVFPTFLPVLNRFFYMLLWAFCTDSQTDFQTIQNRYFVIKKVFQRFPPTQRPQQHAVHSRGLSFL